MKVFFVRTIFALTMLLCNKVKCFHPSVIWHCWKSRRFLSLHFNGHFPGGPGLADTRMSPSWIFLEQGWCRWWRQMELLNVQSSSQIITTNKPTPSFLQARCPSCHPTNNVKALKKKYHIPWTCLPKLIWGVFQLCLWPLIAPGYLGGGLPCLSSALLMPVQASCLYKKSRSSNHQKIPSSSPYMFS